MWQLNRLGRFIIVCTLSERHPVSIINLRRFRLGTRWGDPCHLIIVAAVGINPFGTAADVSWSHFFTTKSRKLDFDLQETKPNKLLLVFIDWLYQNPSTDELEFDSFATNGNVLNDSIVESAEKTFWLFFFFEKLAGSNYSYLRSAFKTIFSKELMSKVSRLWLWKRTKMRKSKYLRS